MHSQIDQKFEAMLTDNAETDDLFNKASVEKTCRKKMLQDVIDIKEATVIHSEGTLQTKRESKRICKEFEKMKSFRPHNLELQEMERIRDNYKTLLNLGFLEPKVL
jgi:uncharacterized membrane protein